MASLGFVDRVCLEQPHAAVPGEVDRGSEQLVLWPFQSKDGPMGKQPQMYAAFAVRVVSVACHPKQEVVAVGYADGTILLVRLDDGAEVLAKKPGAGAVSALAWDATGMLLAWGTEDGAAGIIAL